MPVIDEAEAKLHLKITGVDLDGEILTTYIAAAQEAVERRTGPLQPTTITETALVGTSGSLLLQVTPVLSVTSVTPAGGVALATLPSGFADGVLTWSAGVGPARGQRCTVVYSAGRATCPENLRLAVIEQLRHLVRRYRGARPNPTGQPVQVPLAASVDELIEGDSLPGFA